MKNKAKEMYRSGKTEKPTSNQAKLMAMKFCN